MKTIVCYGDSNTWGYKPKIRLRYPPEVRWTGVCQKALGPEYRVLEEGVNGRTTVFDDPTNPVRNGEKALGYVLNAAKPVDLVILALGTNDLKYTDAAGAAAGAERLIQLLRNMRERIPSSSPYFTEQPAILLVSPIEILARAEVRVEGVELEELHGKSLRLAEEFQKVGKRQGVPVLDAAQYARPSEIDGVHMDPESHQALGLAIARAVKELLG